MSSNYTLHLIKVGIALNKDVFKLPTVERSIYMARLMSVYGNLLTEKQLQALQLHYYEDQSLGEIASQLNVSRQNVHDIIYRSTKSLQKYEDKINLAERTFKIESFLESAQASLEKINCNDEKTNKIISKIKSDIQNALKQFEEEI